MYKYGEGKFTCGPLLFIALSCIVCGLFKVKDTETEKCQ